MSGVDWEWVPTLPLGSWADWATAGVALLALGAAVWAGWAAWSQNRTTNALLRVEQGREDRAERAERRRAEAEARAHQADLVAAWVQYHDHLPTHDLRGDITGMEQDVHAAVIQNKSPLPIYDVSVTFVGPDGRQFEADRTLGVLTSGETVHGPAALRKVTTFVSDEHLDPGTYYFLHDLDRGLRVSIKFRDTAGRRWCRDHDGYLREITSAG